MSHYCSCAGAYCKPGRENECCTYRGGVMPFHPGAFDSIPTFICGSGGCIARVAYEDKPAREVAGNLLEDIGDWVRAAQDHPDVPDGVCAAVLAAHEAVCGWIDWLARGETA